MSVDTFVCKPPDLNASELVDDPPSRLIVTLLLVFVSAIRRPKALPVVSADWVRLIVSIPATFSVTPDETVVILASFTETESEAAVVSVQVTVSVFPSAKVELVVASLPSWSLIPGAILFSV